MTEEFDELWKEYKEFCKDNDLDSYDFKSYHYFMDSR